MEIRKRSRRYTKGWIKGKKLKDGTRVWNKGKVVGTRGEKGVRVHTDSKGLIHGYPVDPSRYIK